LVASAVLPNLKVVSVSKFLLMMAYDWPGSFSTDCDLG
jgi:hypothetical protein